VTSTFNLAFALSHRYTCTHNRLSILTTVHRYTYCTTPPHRYTYCTTTPLHLLHQWIEGQIIEVNFVGEFKNKRGGNGIDSRSRRSVGMAVGGEEKEEGGGGEGGAEGGGEGETEEGGEEAEEATHSPEGYRRVQEVLVHFINWHARFDEWITEKDTRIAPLHSHTSANRAQRGRKERANRRSGRTDRTTEGGVASASPSAAGAGSGEAMGLKKLRYSDTASPGIRLYAYSDSPLLALPTKQSVDEGQKLRAPVEE
jgi:hypothetical protein